MRRYFLALVLIALFSGPSSAQDRPLSLWTVEWPPYVASSLPDQGFVARIVLRALRTQGIAAELIFAPSVRCDAMVRSGRALGAFPLAETEVREAYADFSEPLAVSRTVFFYKTDKLRYFEFTGLDALKPFDIGATPGAYYVPLLMDAGISIDYASHAASSFKKLLLGRVDLVPEDERVGWYTIEQLFPGGKGTFSASETALREIPLFLMTSKKDPRAEQLLERFRRGLAEIKKTGAYRKILEGTTGVRRGASP